MRITASPGFNRENRIQADLHTHTTASDGYLDPEDLVKKAAGLNLRFLGITDHDTVEGIPAAMEAGAMHDLEIIPGVELSVNHRKHDIHVLAYFIDHQSEALLDFLSGNLATRYQRALKIVARLNELGVPISIDDVLRNAFGGSVGRPHIANALVRLGHAFNFKDAFNKYLGDGKPAYIPKPRVSPLRAVDIIRQAGGVAVVAHPGLDLTDAQLEELVQVGIRGIEIHHPTHTPTMVEHYSGLADKLGLLKTGGSDFHGGDKGERCLGAYGVGVGQVLDLRAASEEMRY